MVLQGCAEEPSHNFFIKFAPWGHEETVNATQKPQPKTVTEHANATSVEGKIKPSPPPRIEEHPKAHRVSPKKEEKAMPVVFNFDHADIREVIKVFLKDILKLNYMVDNSVKGSVTLHTEGKLRPDQVMDVFQAVLRINNLALVKRGDLYVVLPAKRAARMTTQAVEGTAPLQNGAYIAIYPLKYISVGSLAGLVKPLLSEGGTIIPERRSNALIVADLPAGQERISKVIKLLDTDMFAGLVFKVFPLKITKASEMAGVLRKIFSSHLAGAKGSYPRMEIIPFASTNSLLVLAKDKKELDTVGDWIQQLDQGEEGSTGIYIYPVENGKAEDIANLLKELYGEQISSSKKSSSRQRTIIPATKKAKTRTKVKVSVPSSGELSGTVKIIPDKVNNLLIIRASSSDYKAIREVLKKVDVVPRQVVIEVMIVEVRLTKHLEYGVEWYLVNHMNIGGEMYKGIAGLNNGGNALSDHGFSGLPSGGLTYALFDSEDQLRALFRQLSDISNIKFLSSPVLIATDNGEARIEVGKEVPIITQSVTNTSADNPNVTSNVDYRKTGIILTVKPHINSGGLVSLDVSQEVSAAQTNTLSGINSPIILNRKVETSMVVQDGHSVLIGGLIQDSISSGTSGIPVLKDLPYIGFLFGHTIEEHDRTELLIALTPHVMRNKEEAAQITDEITNRISEIKSIINSNQHGGEEEHHEEEAQ